MTVLIIFFQLFIVVLGIYNFGWNFVPTAGWAHYNIAQVAIKCLLLAFKYVYIYFDEPTSYVSLTFHESTQLHFKAALHMFNL